jgi:hypothetical protein
MLALAVFADRPRLPLACLGLNPVCEELEELPRETDMSSSSELAAEPSGIAWNTSSQLTLGIPPLLASGLDRCMATPTEGQYNSRITVFSLLPHTTEELLGKMS